MFKIKYSFLIVSISNLSYGSLVPYTWQIKVFEEKKTLDSDCHLFSCL